VRLEGLEQLPADRPYLLCFNHPSWLDPIVLAASWPVRRRMIYFFGPKEWDMSVGLRNRLITWTGRGVPFRPDASDTLDATRRSVEILKSGGVLAVAGEGRLSDHEGDPHPLETGVGVFASLAKVPVVPTAIIGTRWVHFGTRIRLRFGEPVDPADFGPGKQAAAALVALVDQRLRALLEGVEDTAPPGPFGRWLSDAFNDRGDPLARSRQPPQG
jgi:1-acyl-sn-glycerol-3-phosphate acyltransferase